MKKLNGSISIFFAISILLIISIILSVTEIARITCQKLYLQIATDSGLDSMASLYHRKLYEYYSLYGVEYRTPEMLTEEYTTYLSPYFEDKETNTKINNWYTADIDNEHCNLSYKLLIDEKFLEKEILNYIKLKLIGKTLSYFGKDITITNDSNFENLLNETDNLFDEESKSSLYSEIYTRYFNFGTDIKTLENYAKKIQNYISAANNAITSISNISNAGTISNGKSVKNKLEELKTNLKSLNTNINFFKSKMNDFKAIVFRSKDNYELDRLQEKYEFSDDICTFIDDEFEEFISYVDEDSEMNRSVETKETEIEALYNTVEESFKDVSAFVNDLEDIEESLKEARSKKGDERDPDEIKALNEERKDEQAEFNDYLKELKDDYKHINITNIDFDLSLTDRSREESLLDKLLDSTNGILLNSVLDSDKLSAISTENKEERNFSVFSDNNVISVDKLLLTEYELDKFNYYNKNLNAEDTISGSNDLEVERLINGKLSDIDNLKNTVDKILLIRIGLNVLHIYKSREKRQMARTFAYTIFAGFSRLLAETMFLLIITAWGTAQSIVDVKKILKNKRVKFMHDDSTWVVSVDKILDIAAGNILNSNEEDDDGIALNYKDYLRLLLIKERQTTIYGRMCGIIEKNLQHDQENFNFEKLIYSFDVINKFICKHFFTNFIFEDASEERLFDEYYIKITSKRYYYK